MSETPTQTERGPQKVTSAAALKKRSVHKDVTLPSGAVVDIRVPNLTQLAATDGIPNDLIDSAIEGAGRAREAEDQKKVTVEDIKKDWKFIEFIIPKMFVNPKIEEGDVAELDPLDIDLLVSFAIRRNDIDAVGRQLGGLDTQQSFRDHRGIVDVNEAMERLAGDREAAA